MKNLVLTMTIPTAAEVLAETETEDVIVAAAEADAPVDGPKRNLREVSMT